MMVMKSTVSLIAALSILAPLTITSADSIKTLLLDPIDETRERVVPLKIYLPESDSPSPVILFSHGLGGSREANPYLGNHWAKSGYASVFIQHLGSDESVWKNTERAQRYAALKEAANFRSSIHRYQDVPFVIDQLEKWNLDEEHPLSGRFDLTRIGMSGHSYGARTTQGMMGEDFQAGTNFREPRITAFLPFSPSISKRLSPEKSFGHVKAPVLLMTGTKDGSAIDPNLDPNDRTKVFLGLPDGDKFQLVFHEGQHFAFSSGTDGFKETQRIPHHHPAIETISILFWDAYLKGDEAAKATLQSESLREAAGLVENDLWEWK